MTFSRKTVQFAARSLPRLLPSVALLFGIVLLPVAAHAASPWVDAINNLASDFTGPIAKGLSLIAIVWGGVMLAFTESGDSKRMIGGVILGVGMAIGAANFMQWITG